ncbi:MAG TPA: response regulator [Gammaproteobacteria bacterium]
MTINKVLLVDDSPTDLANIRTIVSDAGYSVLTATSGNEAVALAKAERPDLIFMDIVMEGADGYDACREITQNSATKNIPVVFVTSKNQKADRVWAELQGGKAFITKPYTPEQILDQITDMN